jgi:hypothetical protein
VECGHSLRSLSVAGAAARALAALSSFARARRARALSLLAKPLVPRHVPHARPLIAQGQGDLTEHAAQDLLRAYGVDMPKSVLVRDRDAALKAAHAIGFPMVAKVQSPDIAHKTEAGAVRVGIREAATLAHACDEILANARRHAPGASIEGVLLQEEIRDAVEIIVGIENDPSFGPAVMCGLGGIYAEVLKDVTFRLAPVTHDEAHDMIRELRAYAILAGARGKPACDINALAGTIVALSQMALDPLFVLPEGQGVRAGDAFARAIPLVEPTDAAREATHATRYCEAPSWTDSEATPRQRQGAPEKARLHRSRPFSARRSDHEQPCRTRALRRRCRADVPEDFLPAHPLALSLLCRELCRPRQHQLREAPVHA